MILTTSWPKGKYCSPAYKTFFFCFSFVWSNKNFLRVIIHKAIKCKSLFSTAELLFRLKFGPFFVSINQWQVQQVGASAQLLHPQTLLRGVCCVAEQPETYGLTLTCFRVLYTLWLCIFISRLMKSKICILIYFLKENRPIFEAHFNSRTSRIRCSFSRWIISCFSFM